MTDPRGSPKPTATPIHYLDREDLDRGRPARAGGPDVPGQSDPGLLIRTCANCGAEMDERKCKLICRCGYFLSCSDYY